jgi:hypothetical protein
MIVVPPIPPVYGTAVKSSTMASTAALKTFTVTDAVLQLMDLNQFHIFDTNV